MWAERLDLGGIYECPCRPTPLRSMFSRTGVIFTVKSVLSPWLNTFATLIAQILLSMDILDQLFSSVISFFFFPHKIEMPIIYLSPKYTSIAINQY